MFNLTKLELLWEKMLGVEKKIADNTAYTPPAYSSMAEVKTGQKWIDGKDIYMKHFSIPEDTEATGGSALTKNVSTADINYDTLIRVDGFSIRKAIAGESLIISPINSFYSTSTFSLTQFNSKATMSHRVAYSADYYYGGAYFDLYYTKATATRSDDPESEEPKEELKTTKKKTTKKEETK